MLWFSTLAVISLLSKRVLGDEVAISNNSPPDSTSSENAVAKSQPVSLTGFLRVFPDDLLKYLSLSFLFDDIPSLMMVNKSLQERLAEQAVYQAYLAQKYRLPTLAALPFCPEMLQIEGFYFKSNPYYGKQLKPKNLHRRLELGMKPSELTEELTLALYSHFAENPVEKLFSQGGQGYAKYAFQVLLKRRELAFYNSVKPLFNKFESLLKIEDLPDLSTKMSIWFQKEKETFIAFFFNPEFDWSAHLLKAFIMAPQTTLPTDLPANQASKFLSRLHELMLDYNYNDPAMDDLILAKVGPYLQANANENGVADYLLKFNIRFNPDHEFEFNNNEGSHTYSQHLSLLILGAKFDEAIDMLPPPTGLTFDLNCHPIVFNRPEFCYRLISTAPDVYKSVFGNSIFPKQFFTDEKGLKSILAVRRVESVDELIEKLRDSDLSSSDDWIKLVLQFGTFDNYKRILGKAYRSHSASESCIATILFIKDRKNLVQYLTAWHLSFSDKFLNILLPPDAIKVLILNPEALEKVISFGGFSITEETMRQVENTQTFRDASEEIKASVRSIPTAR